jgi:uncharacterized protein with HEPN domain
MSKIDDYARLHHMLDASNKVIQFVKDESRESLDEDEKLALALV